MKTNFTQMRRLVDEFVTERDWKSYHTPRALAEAISIESAELLEHFLFKSDTYIPDGENRVEFENEMADIFIYLLSLMNTLDINDFSEIVLRKLQKNREKYPADEFSGENYQKQ